MFSVVIPLYNKSHTIEDTLASVLAQTYQDFEVIIVNDGSIDNGVEVIKNFTKDPRVHIIHQDNKGVSAARNMGVMCSKYDYIAFLDGDDLWLPGYLAKMKEAIDLFPDAGMICSAGIVKNANGSEYLRLAKKYKDRILEINFFENPHIFLHTSATVVSKEAFNKSSGFPVGMIRNEDHVFFYSLALVSKVVYSGFPLSVYVGGIEGQATSFSADNDIVLLNDIVKRHNMIFENWKKSDRRNKIYKIFLKYELRHCFIVSLRAGNYSVIDYYLNHLSDEINIHFPVYERVLYRTQAFRKMAVLYILLTKIRWIMRGYPRVY